MNIVDALFNDFSASKCSVLGIFTNNCTVWTVWKSIGVVTSLCKRGQCKNYVSWCEAKFIMLNSEQAYSTCRPSLCFTPNSGQCPGSLPFHWLKTWYVHCSALIIDIFHMQNLIAFWEKLFSEFICFDYPFTAGRSNMMSKANQVPVCGSLDELWLH